MDGLTVVESYILLNRHKWLTVIAKELGVGIKTVRQVCANLRLKGKLQPIILIHKQKVVNRLVEIAGDKRYPHLAHMAKNKLEDIFTHP